MELTLSQPVAFNKACLAGSEHRYIAQAIANAHISGDGVFGKACESFLEAEIGVQKALLTTNCTHALEMAALLVDVQPGDEVILPSFTFVSTANAFVLRGARPVFVDVRPDTLNIDEELIEQAISDRTKAIVVVHYAGVSCEMDVICSIARRHGIPVIEDNAHGLFGRYRGRFLGTFGVLATQSFHETKNFTCGEGGALLINEGTLREQAEIIREKGTNRTRFYRGQVDKYTWVSTGSSYVPSDILAAFLFAQFEAKDRIQQERKSIWERYDTALRPLAEKQRLAVPHVPAHCDQAYHMYYVLLPDLEQRQGFISHLKARSISAVFHYTPLHTSEMAVSIGADKVQCPVTERVSDCLVRLPFHNGLTQGEQERVIAAIYEYCGEALA